MAVAADNIGKSTHDDGRNFSLKILQSPAHKKYLAAILAWEVI
jgi:hypothetical protein